MAHQVVSQSLDDLSYARNLILSLTYGSVRVVPSFEVLSKAFLGFAHTHIELLLLFLVCGFDS